MQSEIVFARILLPFCIGILFGNIFSSEILYSLFFAFSLAMLTVLVIWQIFYRTWKLYNYRSSLGGMVYLLFFFLGGYICLQANESLRASHFSKQEFQCLKVIIVSEPQIKNKNMRFIAQVNSGYANKKLYASLGKLSINLQASGTNKLSYGDEIIIPASYRGIDPPLNPGEFDYKNWLQNQNIRHQIYVRDKNYFKTGLNKGNLFIRFGYSLRKKLIKKYDRMIQNREAFAVASTLVLGYRADLDPETRASYSATGTVHALSVSGAHVAIVYLFIDFILRFCDNKKILKITKLIVILTSLWGYALLTGFSPAVLRAAIMLSAFILAKNFYRQTNSYNILSFSAFCLSIYNPYFLFDVGFQLSFIAVLGLLYIQPLIYHSIYIKNEYLDKLWNVVALSVAAQLITFPLSVYYFHQFPVYFLLGNLFIILPVNAIMGLGLLSLVPGFTFIGPMLEFVIHSTNQTLHWMATLPYSTVNAIYISKVELILLILSLILLFIAIERRANKVIFLSLLLFIGFETNISFNKVEAWNRRQILFYSLPKNYATAFIWKDSAIIVSDLQVENKIFQFHITPALEKYRIKHFKILSLANDTVSGSFRMHDSQIKFFDTRILLVNQEIENSRISGNSKFEVEWMHNNRYQHFTDSDDVKRSKVRVFDATNSTYYQRQALKNPNKNHPTLYFLKKNPAYLLRIK